MRGNRDASSDIIKIHGTSFLDLSAKNITKGSANDFMKELLELATFSVADIFGFRGYGRFNAIPKLDYLVSCATLILSTGR